MVSKQDAASSLGDWDRLDQRPGLGLTLNLWRTGVSGDEAEEGGTSME